MKLLEEELSDKYVEVVSLGYIENMDLDEYDVVLNVGMQKFHISKGCCWSKEEALFMKAMLGKALAVIVMENNNIE